MQSGGLNELQHGFMATKRYGSAQEVAGMVVWLTGHEPGIVTGAMHVIDDEIGARGARSPSR